MKRTRMIRVGTHAGGRPRRADSERLGRALELYLSGRLGLKTAATWAGVSRDVLRTRLCSRVRP
jgi:hypothetical protein